MTESAEPTTEQGNARSGCLTFWILIALVVAAVFAAVKLWPASAEEREEAAIDACKEAVGTEAPTEWRKVWEDVTVTGDDELKVRGKFSTRDSGMRGYSCTVTDGKATNVIVSP